jgi:hypothetical protein
MARRLSSRRLLWLIYMLLLWSSVIQPCSLSRLYRRRNALLLSYRYYATSHPHSPPFSTAPSPSSSLWSSRLTSYRSTLSFSTPSLLPTSVFSTDSSMSTIALSVNRISRFLPYSISLTVVSLAFNFFTIASCSLRHFRHSRKGCATVCLLPLHY